MSGSVEAKKTRRGQIVNLAVFAIGAVPGTFAVMGLLGKLSHNNEICSNFYPQYACALGLAALIACCARMFKPVLFLTPFLLLCAWKLVPFYLPQSMPTTAQLATLKLAQCNVNTHNAMYKEVVDYVLSTNADVAGFEEVSQEWTDELSKRIGPLYPYKVLVPLGNNFGVAFFSKLPIEKSSVEYPANYAYPVIVADIRVAGRLVTIVTAHPLPPMRPDVEHARNLQFEAIAKLKKDRDARFILIGDLNCSSWSPYFHDLLAALNAQDSQMGFGVQPSWPITPVFLRTPIDHMLTTDHFRTIRREIGPGVGSDHLPVFGEVGLYR